MNREDSSTSERTDIKKIVFHVRWARLDWSQPRPLIHLKAVLRSFDRDVMASSGETVLDEYEWERLPDMATVRCYTVGAYHLNKLYILGKLLLYILGSTLQGGCSGCVGLVQS